MLPGPLYSKRLESVKSLIPIIGLDVLKQDIRCMTLLVPLANVIVKFLQYKRKRFKASYKHNNNIEIVCVNMLRCQLTCL